MNPIIQDCIDGELRFARAKFPNGKFNHAALVEEMGELAQSLIDHAFEKDSAEHVFLEAIQVAAMAIRVAEEGSAEFPYRFEPGHAKQFEVKRAMPRPCHWWAAEAEEAEVFMGPYKTREEAITKARKTLTEIGDHAYESFFVGAAPYMAISEDVVDPETFLDWFFTKNEDVDLEGDAGSRLPEGADADLETRLSLAVKQWICANGIGNIFHTVDDFGSWEKAPFNAKDTEEVGT